MFTLTKMAAEHIQKSLEQGRSDHQGLRIAAKRGADGAIEYLMGFDHSSGDDDIRIVSEGISVIIDRDHKDLLSGAILDYVELEEGSFHFIFMNPNDPHYKPPTKL